MSFIDGLRHRIYVLRRGRAYEREIEREARFHVELGALGARLADDHEAELSARRNFGNVTYYREEVRRMTPLAWLDGLRQDISYALRGIRRAPGFAAMVVATMGLGLGVNAAMFSLLDHLLIQAPAGVARPGEIRRLYISWKRPAALGGRQAFDFFTYPHVRAIVAQEDPALAIAAFSEPDSVLMSIGDQRVTGMLSRTSQSYFSVLGIRPALGRFPPKRTTSLFRHR